VERVARLSPFIKESDMPSIPETSGLELIDKIYEGYVREDNNDKLYLGRLGSSSIGNECIRETWFSWRAFDREEFEGRVLRLFGTGHWQEDRVVEDLRRAGFSVWEKRDDGKQYECVDDTGHFITKLDGIIKGVPRRDGAHILEIKTHNKASYNALYKHGVQKSKPVHYAQIQITMKLQGLSSCVYLAVCKDDEKMYCEIIEADQVEQDKILKRIKSLTEATMRPAGISDDANSFGCKFCTYKEVCVRTKEPLRNCRTCVMAQPTVDGQWLCNLNNHTLSFDDQRAACEEYEAL